MDEKLRVVKSFLIKSAKDQMDVLKEELTYLEEGFQNINNCNRKLISAM